MPRSAASSTASDDGAPTATRSGHPATAAFWTSSNESRPLTQRIASRERQQTLAERPADDLVDRVVAADVLAQAQQLAVRREEPGRVEAAGRPRTRPAPHAAAPAARPRARPATRRSLSIARRLDRDRLERPLAADPARRRGVEVPPDAAEVESRAPRPRPCSPPGRPAASPRPGDSPSASAKPSASSSSCPGVRIVTATGSPPIRISSGSSTATTSSASPPGTRHAQRRRVGRRLHWKRTPALAGLAACGTATTTRHGHTERVAGRSPARWSAYAAVPFVWLALALFNPLLVLSRR